MKSYWSGLDSWSETAKGTLEAIDSKLTITVALKRLIGYEN